jgi:hypothetical protein
VDAAAPQSRAWGAVGMRDAHMAHRREGRHDRGHNASFEREGGINRKKERVHMRERART